MKRAFPIGGWIAALMMGATLPAQEVLEQLGDRLNFSLAGGALQLKLSGSLELEGYAYSAPVADLVSGERDTFFNPRFTLYFDAQSGDRLYLFSQLKLDRGYDVYTEETGLQARFDEYAVRFAAYQAGADRVFLQAGKFATLIGGWTKRHTAWENAFITAPMPYDNLTGVWDVFPVPSVTALLAWSHVQPVGTAEAVLADKHLRLPIVWGAAYAPGVAVAGRWGRLDVAAEIKTVGVSSRPERWDEPFGSGERPTVNARVGWRPDPSWDLGFSVSRGEYLDREPHPRIPAGSDRHDYLETVIAQDIAFNWRHWQVWGEIFAARFTVPGLGNLDTVAGYVETKYRFTPRFSGAVRWNQQFFSHVLDSTGRSVRWDREAWRLDVAPAWRLSPQMQFKLQYSLRHEDPAVDAFTHALAAQLNVRF
jgi:hypothetical protein